VQDFNVLLQGKEEIKYEVKEEEKNASRFKMCIEQNCVQ
jgi:hypothetical protein